MFVDALDDDISASVPGDAFAQARAAARARFEEFTKTFPGKVAEGSIAPEKLTTRINQAGVSNNDVRTLRESLLTGNRVQRKRGFQALQDLRAQTLGDVVNGPAMASEGFNGGALYKRFANNQDRLRTILTPGQFSRLQDYSLAARDATTQVPHSAVNNSNTVAGLANLFNGNTVQKDNGFLARMFARGVGMVSGIPMAGDVAELAVSAIPKATNPNAARQFAAASNMDEAARALAEARNTAVSDDLRLIAWKRWQDLLNNSPAVGAGVVAPFSGKNAQSPQ